MQNVRANISLRAIYDNAVSFRRVTGTRLCAVVKANAYGHGAERVVCALNGVADCFAVSLFREAKAIRVAACGRDILVLTPPLCDEEILVGLYNGFICTVADIDGAKRIARLARERRLTARVHIKTNTGMNRYGVDGAQLRAVCDLYQDEPFVRVEGVYSHFYQTNRTAAEEQFGRFTEDVMLCKRFFPNVIAHIAATYGAACANRYALDMVRVGIGLYGYLPDGAEDIPVDRAQSLTLQKAMTVTATVSACREYRFGGAGYGVPVWKESGESAPTYLSVCRIGYADGVLRRRENGAETQTSHANAACMDATVLTEKHTVGEEICILRDAAETARKTGTISYEVLCAATRRAELVYDET